jgi:hypothetical protein
MGRHHTSTDTAVVELSIPAPRVSPEARPVVAQPSAPQAQPSAPQAQPSAPQAQPSAPQPRGWRARRVARVEAAQAQAHAVQLAHAQRRARQVALASLPVE